MDAYITAEEVLNSIKRLNTGKAGGIDGIVSEMLKAGGTVVVQFLVKLFNRVFDSGTYPKEWSKAILIPIYKKGNSEVPDNYRGVSLISTVSKCYTSILNKRLYCWIEENGKIHENQAGFREGYATTDHIFTLYSIVQKCLNKRGGKLYAAFVDLRKAFDSVNHELLMKVVFSEGIRGKLFRSIKVMYESLISCVRVDSEYSEFFKCPVGVRQGCVLSPTLFSLFINKLATHISETGVHGIQLLPTLLELFILLFADDVVLLSTTPGGLQVQLNSLKECCDHLKLTVNKEKTKVMVFRKGGYLGKQEKWYFDKERLEVVNNYCYLGFTFSTKLSSKIGTNNLVVKGKKALYLLIRSLNSCRDLSQKVFFKLFDARVQSILLYSSEIWGLQRLELLERVHLLACKKFLGVPLKTPNKMVYSELKRYPLYINSCVRAIKYWFRILAMDLNRLPKQAYIMLARLDENGKICWVTSIRSILSSTGFYYVWLNQGVGSINRFLSAFKQRMVDVFIQEWSTSIREKERYSMYRSFVREFGNVHYLLDIDVYCFRIAFTQIRMGVLPINVNLQRYSDQPGAKMCPFCINKLEDEMHVLKKCPLYADIRERYSLNDCRMSLANMLDGMHLSTSKTVAKFVFYAMKRRQSFIEN